MTNIFANPKTYDFLLTNKTNHFLIIGGGLLPPEKNVQYTEQAQPIKLSKLTGASFNDLRANYRIEDATRDMFDDPNVLEWTAINGTEDVPDGGEGGYVSPYPSPSLSDTYLKATIANGNTTYSWSTVATGGGEGGGSSLPEPPFKGSGENATYALTSYKNESDEVIQEWTDIHETKANRLIMQNWNDPVDPFIQRSGGGSLYWGSPSAGDTMVFDLNSKKIAQGVLPYPYPSRGDDGKALVTSVDAGGTATYSWGDVGGGQRQSGSYDIYDEKGNDIFVNYTIYPDIADHIVDNSFEDASRDFSSLDYTPVEGKSDWYLLIKVEKTGVEEHFKTKVLSTASMYSVMIEEMPNLAIFTDADTISYSIIRVKLGNVTNSNPINKDFSITGGAIEVNKVVFPSNENYVKKLVLPSLTSIPTTGSKLSVISETSDKVILGFESAPVEDNFTNCYKLMEDFDFANPTEANNTTALLARGWEVGTGGSGTASITAISSTYPETFGNQNGNYKFDEVGLLRLNVTRGAMASNLAAAKVQHNMHWSGGGTSMPDFELSTRFRLGTATTTNSTSVGVIYIGLMQKGLEISVPDVVAENGIYVKAFVNINNGSLSLQGVVNDYNLGARTAANIPGNPFFDNQFYNNYRVSMKKEGSNVYFSLGGGDWTSAISLAGTNLGNLVPTILVTALNGNQATKTISVLVDYIECKILLPNRGLI